MQPKKISYASGNGNPNKFLIFQEMGTFRECFREQKPRKNFLYFPQKKAVLMFQETEGPMDLFIYFGCI